MLPTASGRIWKAVIAEPPSVFGNAALARDMLMPIIELLRRAPILNEDGEEIINGLFGQVIIPRQGAPQFLDL